MKGEAAPEFDTPPAAAADRGLSPKARALAWLAQREHSRLELRRKLMRLVAKSGHDPEEGCGSGARCLCEPCVERLLDWLQERGYLSDARFAESRVHARASRYGNLRIAQELQQHGVAAGPETLSALRASEYERAAEVWRRKFGGEAADDPAERARQMRFLARRGFSGDVVRRVLRAAGEDG